ncbi:MAG: hypothetical protein JNK05_35890 [Myxococcales bacterium]|nr:hypothetical protein [Myxococcales bacterium]
MEENAPSTAYLVESIPWGLESLRCVPGVQYTEDVLVRLVKNAHTKIDLTAMYWNLLPDPEGDDERGFSEEQFERMGAGTGRALLDALRDAARRGVRIRILESPGFSGKPQESATLRAEHPDAVSIQQISMDEWYGGGIMHQKLWVFDDRDVYVGSANMDWKSIAQVKEMGLVFEGAAALAEDAARYFEGWWLFAATPRATRVATDPEVKIDREVPAWSSLVEPSARALSPLDDPRFRAAGNAVAPLVITAGAERGTVFLSGSPREVNGPLRTYDGDALSYTIDDAQKSVCVSVMDFAPASLYSRKPLGDGREHDPANAPVWWSRLFDAVLSAALTKRVHVRLLVSKWAHTSPIVEPFLQALQRTADAGRADARMLAAQLEVKLFTVPGWDSTVGARRAYPGHSRVNHTKYIVTDRRINVGTSNMTWDYFASTAGTSVNCDHPTLVRALQSVFDRDWNGPFATRLRL